MILANASRTRFVVAFAFGFSSVVATANTPEPPGGYCFSGIRDDSGQCCAVGEEVVDGVCTLRITAPPGDAVGTVPHRGDQ